MTTQKTESSLTSFSSFSLAPELLAVVEELGFSQPTPIQAQSIPILLEGKDVIGQSKTGSGKTAAFALPLLQKISLEPKQLQGLILCPTRELALQVVRDLRRLGRAMTRLHVLPLIGGEPSRPQIEGLESGAHIVVGTPGRVLDLLEKGKIDFTHLHTLVLDEADRMLDMGFEPDIHAIIETTPETRQTVLFSATFPISIEDLSRQYQSHPIRIVVEDPETVASTIEQIVYKSEGEDKIDTLMRLLQQHPAQTVLIFCNQKITVAEIGERLADQRASSAVLHGDLEQKERERVMAMFRNGSYRLLVATDVAARGLDIENLELVVNFDLPSQHEIYIHRIGRTGRAGRVGTAVSLIESREEAKILEIERLTSFKIERKNLGFKNQHGLGPAFQHAPMQTISISGGRKDKLRPGDILGALTGEAAKLSAADIGKIEIHDHLSYVAVADSMASRAFQKLRDGKIKGRKFQVRLLR